MIDKQKQNHSQKLISDNQLVDLEFEFENLPAEAKKFVNFAKKSRSKGEANQLNSLDK